MPVTKDFTPEMAKKYSLKWRFLRWIALGFILILAIPLIVCSTMDSFQRATDRQQHSEQNQANPYQLKNGTVSLTRRDNSIKTKNNNQDTANSYHSRNPYFDFCRNLKVTDLALVWFTYCLVVVGWFQIENTERTIQDLERAFIYGGTMPIEALSGAFEGWNNFELIAANYGRTNGIIKEVYWVLSEQEPPGDVPTYKGAQFKRFETAISPSTPTDKFMRIETVAKPSNFGGDFFVYGCIKYKDIFGKTHLCRFCNKLISNNRNPIPAGDPAWNKDD